MCVLLYCIIGVWSGSFVVVFPGGRGFFGVFVLGLGIVDCRLQGIKNAHCDFWYSSLRDSKGFGPACLLACLLT